MSDAPEELRNAILKTVRGGFSVSTEIASVGEMPDPCLTGEKYLVDTDANTRYFHKVEEAVRVFLEVCNDFRETE